MFGNRAVKQAATTAMLGILFLATSGAAQAQHCSTASLKGLYSVSFQGEVLGILSSGVLTPFPTPTPVNGLEVINFDGAGNYTDLAIAVANGVLTAATAPNLNQNGFQPLGGTYSVDPDCTGIALQVEPTQDVTFTFVISNGGRTLRSVITKQHVFSIENNPNCTAPNGCDLAVQVSTVGEKVATGQQGD